MTRAPKAPLWRIRETLSPGVTALLGLVVPAAAVVLWWWLTRESTPGVVESRIVNINILPAPAEMFARDTLRSLWFERELSRSAVVSLGRVCSGFAIAAAVAVPLGVAMGAFTKVAALFRPLMTAGGYLPVAALVPLTLVWFGTGEAQKVGFLAIAVFVYLLPMVVAAVDGVDQVYLQTAQTQGASRAQLVARVLVPIALPKVYGSLRLAFGVAWSWIILAEVVAAERGLGFIINTAQGRGTNMGHVYLTLATIIGLSFVLDRLWAGGDQLLFPYKRGAHA
ncbi:MAG: ABC transporter permease subunit [Armatimonadetes bacterium]|nr:ABC transporter permease subunit [Armatimonadota bacterium]